MGEAFAASGDLVAALEAYERAVDLAPAESSYWRLLAVFSAENEVQVLEVGVAAGQKAVELSPKDPQALDALGWAYAQAGYLVKAEDALLKALDQSPQNATAHLHLGIVYLRWGQNALASQQLDRAVQADPGGGAGEAARKLLQMYYSQ
jgi:Flp pilus assembly protein TadD